MAPPSRRIKYIPGATVNEGAQLISHTVDLKAVGVDKLTENGVSILHIFPNWGPGSTELIRDATIRAFAGGRLVIVETQVTYRVTGNYSEYKDYGR